jgi:hypothetical protein
MRVSIPDLRGKALNTFLVFILPRHWIFCLLRIIFFERRFFLWFRRARSLEGLHVGGL